MQLTSLPSDLIENILSKVPDTPLARFRTTSKQWNGSRINLHEPSVKVATHPFYLKDPLYNSSQVDIRHVFNCDGLLLCSTKDDRLVVWDPYSGETKWIKPRDRYKYTDYFALGFDNKFSCKQYKILRVDRQFIGKKNIYEVYDFTSDCWRVLGTATDWFLAADHRGISVKGNTYWVALQIVGLHVEFILSFDFSKETFQSLPLPDPSPRLILALSVVKEEQLCLLGFHVPNVLMGADESLLGLQVWVTTSTGSWNKSLAVIGIDAYKDMLSIGISFLADEQNKVVMYLNTGNNLHILRENKHILEEHLGGGSTSISSPAVLMNYPPSLARIRQGTFLRGRKRKAESM
uniref:F-box domain-containing protein n=1 Tax=Brassica oleracea var. oleracea TaxID=109376 RepID=A0A0D3BCX2_BRAOL